MASELVIVNGVPGSGKSTLAADLAAAMDAPMLSKDVLKEFLAELSTGTVAGSYLGALAMETLWSLASAIPGRVVIESVWFDQRDTDYVRRGLARVNASALVELWCDVPVEVAFERFDRRAPSRHSIHASSDPAGEAWRALVPTARPVALSPVLRVDTTGLVDISALVSRISEVLASPEWISARTVGRLP